jgi:hypothetical protein
VGGPSSADPPEYADRLPAGDPLEVDDVRAVEDGELHVLVRGLIKVGQEGHGRLAQPKAAGGEDRDLPQPQPDLIAAVGGAFQRTPGDQFTDQPVGGGHRHAGAAADLGERELRSVAGERVQHAEDPAGHRPPGTRREAASFHQADRNLPTSHGGIPPLVYGSLTRSSSVTLDDGPAEEAAGAGRRQVGTDREPARRLAADGHLARIAAEGTDVALHPAQGRLLVEEVPVDARRRVQAPEYDPSAAGNG